MIEELKEQGIKDIKEELKELSNKIDTMNQKIDNLFELLEKDCKKMTSHIDFVENVYDKIKQPFNFIMDKVEILVSNNQITYEE